MLVYVHLDKSGSFGVNETIECSIQVCFEEHCKCQRSHSIYVKQWCNMEIYYGESRMVGWVWERFVQTVKQALKKVIGRSCLSFKELRTLLVEVESIVIARLLTYVYDDLDGISSALTPSHLINGRCLQPTSNASQFEIVSTYKPLTRQSQHQKHLLYQFIETWQKDYLVSLHGSHAASTRRSGDAEIMIGDLVLLQNKESFVEIGHSKGVANRSC